VTNPVGFVHRRPEHGRHDPGDVETNLADTYTVTAEAPDGWAVVVDASGQVSSGRRPAYKADLSGPDHGRVERATGRSRPDHGVGDGHPTARA